jgi:predicted Zn-dependent protease
MNRDINWRRIMVAVSMQRQAIARVCRLRMRISLPFAVCLISTFVAGSSSPAKRSESDRDISAIGHRKIANRRDLDSYSFETEKRLGAQLSSNLDRSTSLLHDATTAAYVERLAKTVVRNSDSRFPITLRIIDSEEVYAFTLFGGYQYISRGLLLKLGNECEVASVLARGIAHTALHSAMHEPTRIAADGDSSRRDAVNKKIDKFDREEELSADYFGIQYLYKSGYDPGCFLTVVQTVWTDNPAKEFRAFPPVPERVKALQDEIGDILPKRDGAVTNAPEFHDWREHLLKMYPSKPETKSESRPTPSQP